jgi:MFS family permease
LVIFMGDAFERFGPRRIVLLGSVAMGAGVVGLTIITAPWQIYAAFILMSVGWASMSGAAINIIIAPWFEHKRGLAVSLALNGGSCGGVFIVPLLMLLIARFGFACGLYITVGTMLVVLVPSVITFLHRNPHELGLLPDGEAPSTREQTQARHRQALNAAPWRRTAALRRVDFWTISIPFALGLATQVGFLTHQMAYLEPLLGNNQAGFAVSMTTTAAVIGRLITGAVIDRLNRRMISSLNFAIQALALAVMIMFPTRTASYLACVGFGLGVGNMVSLPALIVQQEFPQEHFAKTISLIVALNQFMFALGAGVLGVIRDVTGSYSMALLLCIFLQTIAAGIVLIRHKSVQTPGIQSQQGA